ncbi:hypothetical protein V1514DRAFT_329194 [Lipomyces japonicus]|uniref:uncharacterized protein n=1 Tax=Lipomyces japonicus TaxID=56871 RepID=UPI0034CD8EE7
MLLSRRAEAPAVASPGSSPPENDNNTAKHLSDQGLETTPVQALCAHCHKQLESPTIRAMNLNFHRDCFVCSDCGKSVLNRFFPFEVLDESTHSSKPIPLCERDFFRRKSLLCHVCDEALRGDYVMAVGHKYHLEHFTCSICPRVFGANDNYYERDGAVYCHYHFSTLFAERCEGCHRAILKQFIENLRNGRHEHWHPECYMIHKFWNVKITDEILTLSNHDAESRIWKDESDLSRQDLKQQQQAVENQVYRIWTVLSGFEEVSAACISDMLQYASNGATTDAVLAAGRLIYRVQVLFSAIDTLRQNYRKFTKSVGKLPKTLCKTIVNFLTTVPGGFNSESSLTKDLLDLVTSIAHYLKLLIQFGLDTALSVDKQSPVKNAVNNFLDYLSSHNSPPALSRSTLIPGITDQCVACKRGVEEKCVRYVNKNLDDKRDRRYHLVDECFKCGQCSRSLCQAIEHAKFSEVQRLIMCPDCVLNNDHDDGDAQPGFVAVSRLSQYSFLLKVALQRVYRRITDDDHANQDGLHRAASTDKIELVEGYVNTLTDIRRLRSSRFKRAISDATGKQARRAKTDLHSSQKAEGSLSPSLSISGKFADKKNISSPRQASHNSMGKRLGSMSDKNPPSPENLRRAFTTPTKFDHQESYTSSPPSVSRTDILFGEKYLTLDDIPRIVAAEQAREQRPNAFRHQRQSSLALGSGPVPKLVSTPTASHQINASESSVRQSVDGNATASDRKKSAASLAHSVAMSTGIGKKFFSELESADYFLVRHLAAVELQPLLRDYFSANELLEILSESEANPSNGTGNIKSSFWEKFGKAFSKTTGGSGNNATTSSKRKGGNNSAQSLPGVFNVALDVLVERSGTESTLGVSAGRLKVPAFLDDCISAMRRKDMSVEGVFRKNGNIRKLKALSELIDKSVTQGGAGLGINFDAESPVQLAALLKKFLRELPDPLLTFRLYRVWVISQKIPNDEIRKRVMHLSCCLLPRSNRDSMEIIFNFLKWVASFSHVDEESGSKMDIHNLSTVITPNILYSPDNGHDYIENPASPTRIVPVTSDQEEPLSQSQPVGGIAGDSYFLAIEAVNALIENHDEFSAIPEDIFESMQNQVLSTTSLTATTH